MCLFPFLHLACLLSLTVLSPTRASPLVHVIIAENVHNDITHDVQPQQVHLSFAANPSDIVVTWSTVDKPGAPSIVEYGTEEEDLIYSTSANVSQFVDGGVTCRTQYVHRATISGLVPGQKYYYRCGSELGWSALYSFRAVPDSTTWSPRLAVYGDLGAENPQSLPRLQKEAQEGMYDSIYHIGDFGYDMYEEEGQLGDRFMRQIETIAAYVPYMTAVGNHEEKYNFSHYKNRFSMPGSEDGLMYSFNLGPVHFVTISTEFYYFLNYGFKQVVKQYDWLVNDLKEANAVANRTARPWIIINGHRPMYCSNADRGDCVDNETTTRTGLPPNNMFALEPLLYEYGVDLALWAHEHSYERLWPIYNRTVMNGSTDQPYVHPRATVHVTTGSAGCREEKSTFVPDKPVWSAFRSNDYGYSRLHILNGTHLHMEQVSDDQQGKVIDEFWMVKNNPWTFRANS